MALAPGTRLGPYEVLGVLGAGGMGEVYRARDTRLNRDVALKVLPELLAGEPDRLTRFEREGQVLASLNHPNIAVIYGLEGSGGACALVLELVEGPTLAERVERGPLEVEEALKICRQIAAALEAAHAKAVIHRDLKPANVKVTPEGQVKLLDFGLAKALANAGAHSDAAALTVMATGAGKILGTPAYMSPEQARGKPVDKRTDIWAFGCVLYELLAGRQAFQGETFSDMIASVLEREPDFGALPAMIPGNIHALLRRCLQKDPGRRVHDIADARIEIDEALRSPVSTPSPAPGRAVASLAVLPFANASGDPQMDYLSDGLAESIILSLSQLPTLRVMARSTVFRYKGRGEEAQEVGRALGVGAVVTGRVLQRGETLVVSAELIDVENGWQLWGGQYRRKVADIFATEEEIAKEISGALRLKLTPDNEQVLAKRYTENVKAYHLYLKGRFYWGKRTEDALYKAIQYFRQALESDPTYALAYSGLAECYIPLAFYGHLAPKEALPKARAAAQSALEIDSALSEARTVLGFVKNAYDWDQPGAEKEFNAAIELNPHYPRARQGLAECFMTRGWFPEAFAQIKQALELDPLSLSMHAAFGMVHYYGRQYDKAIEQCWRAVEMDSTFFPARWILGLALEQKGQFVEAAAQLQQARVLSSNSTNMVANLGGVFAAWGKEQEARDILRQLDELASRKYVSQTLVAGILAGLGEKERALTCLEQACEERCCWLRCLMSDPRLQGLRTEERFQKLARRVGFVQQLN